MKFMKTYLSALPLALCLYSCAKTNQDQLPTSTDRNPQTEAINYRQEMRNFVIGISKYAKGISPGFAIIPQNGPELLTTDGQEDGPLATAYIAAIDGIGRENLLYGYDYKNDVRTPEEDILYMQAFCDRVKATKKVLVTDYCHTPKNVDSSYVQNNRKGYISFASPTREMDKIPAYPAKPYAENNANINTLMQAKNFLYLINPEKYTNKQAFISEISRTNYDVLLMDLYFNDKHIAFTAAEIDQLKHKANGGKRLVICYLSIGQVEKYRYYWQPNWKTGNPVFVGPVDPHWKGNLYCQYWNADWQSIIYGKDDSYLKKILDAHFDGAYLDIIDAYDHYENPSK
ncbi:endo alpha-1,4 polygalactosaminidase [Chitinophaga pendula]|uniref:endo alpha-1,4 polygalactosaminidase n=1 Tax=Chitinophaga TaxID=79328 RepID=UPI000BAF441E|nr:MULTISPECIES: endo alpha-1,4 polygalactosaminidase [Chitinophaga]ASZ12329.1 hypothetical protein CK934_15860 [Chitinophaga sp. MD30]UCJ10077.1 endo alpha-1,4 polygalactosaminidase [Chitinophaga pendula]